MEEDFAKDLEALETELQELKVQLGNIDAQRGGLAVRIQQVSGAAAYLRGKLGVIPEEIVEEKPDETTEENSEA
jgi:hypothetical protein